MRRLSVVSVLTSIAPIHAVEAATPMSYLAPTGEMGRRVTPLLMGLLGVSIIVVVVISALVLIGALRRGQNAGAENTPLVEGEAAHWIGIGVGVSTIVLVALVAWTSLVMAHIANPPSQPALTIEIRGHQWWWEAIYQNEDPSQIFSTANEIHVPVGKPVLIALKGMDVIHSFWVPSLGGKTEMIPGQTNVTWLEADRTGVYRGQCSEYCGAQHAHMAFLVKADSPDSFELWRLAQLRSAAEPATTESRLGETRFVERCGACHTVRGTRAGGRLGPDLTHLVSRTTIAANLLTNNEGYRDAWISAPQHFKPGAFMPDLDLSGPDLAAIHAFLATLK